MSLRESVSSSEALLDRFSSSCGCPVALLRWVVQFPVPVNLSVFSFCLLCSPWFVRLWGPFIFLGIKWVSFGYCFIYILFIFKESVAFLNCDKLILLVLWYFTAFLPPRDASVCYGPFTDPAPLHASSVETLCRVPWFLLRSDVGFVYFF